MKNKKALHIMPGTEMINICNFADRIIASLFEFKVQGSRFIEFIGPLDFALE